MLFEEIQKLVDTTQRKPRRIFETFDEVLQALVGSWIKVSKANDESRSTEWEYGCATALDMFCKLVKEDIQYIMT